MMEENPPLPEEQTAAEHPVEALPQPARRIKAVVEEDIVLGEEKVEEVLVEAPKVQPQEQQRPKELQKH